MMRVSRFLCRRTKDEERGTKGCVGWRRALCEFSPSSHAIAAPLFASWPSPAPGRSSESRSGTAGGVRAPAPSRGHRPARRHCPGLSLSASGPRRWERVRASDGLIERRTQREETVWRESEADSEWIYDPLFVLGQAEVNYNDNSVMAVSHRLSAVEAPDCLARQLLVFYIDFCFCELCSSAFKK